MADVYQTREGPKTEEQLRAELQGAGYGGPWDVNSMLTAYGRAGGGGGGGGGGYAGGGGGYDIGGGYGMIDPYQQALQMLLQTRQQEMQRYGGMGRVPIVLEPERDYAGEIAGFMNEWSRRSGVHSNQMPVEEWVAKARTILPLPDDALRQIHGEYHSADWMRSGIDWKAALAGTINRVAQTAVPSFEREQWEQSQSGYMGGKPTFAREQWEALERARQAQFEEQRRQWETGTTGYLGERPTMAREEAEALRRQREAQITGYFGGAGGAGGAPTLERERWQTGETGYLGGAPTLARQQYETSTGQALLNLASQLRGPENYFQYANMLAGAQGSPNLEFAQRLASGQRAPAYGNWGPSQPATLAGLVGAGQQAPGATTPPQAPATTAPPATTPFGPGRYAWAPNFGQQPGMMYALGGAGQQAGTEPRMGIIQPIAGGPIGQAPQTQPAVSSPTPRIGGYAWAPQTGQPGMMSALGGAGTQRGYAQIPRPRPQLPQIVAPHKADVRDVRSWSPTFRAMYGSLLGAGGYNPEDWFALSERAAPKGYAPRVRSWTG